MSKIQGKPFVESVIDTLGDKKKDLLKLVNGSDQTPAFRSLMNASHLITGADKNKVQFVVLETWNKTYTGYLVYNNSYCVLFAFHNNTQDMEIVSIDLSKQSYKLIKQPLSIVEFRMYLMEANDHIEPGEIDSGEAKANALLVADGEGGADFVSPEEGSAQYLLGLDSEGNIVKDELPEGIVVDQTIVEDSENAVAGGAVHDALAEIGEDITDINNALETKANVDGNYPTMTVGAADNLTPYDEDSGVDQEQPFLLQGTGCGNGEQQVDTGALGLLKEKQGNTVVVNQQVKELNATNWSFESNVTGSFANGEVSFTNSAVGYGIKTSSVVKMPANHKVLIILTGKVSSNTPMRYLMYGSSPNVTVNFNLTTNYQTIFNLADVPSGVSGNGILYIYSTTENITCDVKSVVFIDLTQWFNGNIPAHLLAHPEDFFRYYQGSLAYNEGELVNANGRYLKTIGRNQWDEEWEIGGINTTTGQTESNNTIRSKNFVKVIPNTTYFAYNGSNENDVIYYYDKDKNYISYQARNNETFTTPANCCFIKLRSTGSYGTTYNHDITISIYYEGESGYDQYYPYEELANIDTSTETLLAYDYKEPNGTIHRNTTEYTFTGSESWTQYGTSWVCNQTVTKGASNLGVYHKSNLPFSIQWASAHANQFEFVNPGWSTQAEAQAATSGKKIQYKVATPTTEQGTSFSENVVIDDFGSMDFGGTNGVPQGASIFYAVDYKAFVDSLYNTLDGDATDIVKDSELDSKLATLGYVKLTSVSGYDATKTQVLKNVEGTLTWVTEE